MSLVKSLSALVPVPITDSMLISSVASEDSSPAWNAATAYAVGDIVHRTQTHRRYKCAIAGTNANNPEDDPDRWQDLAPTNKWACFDRYTTTRTLIPSGTPIVIKPGYFNAIELRGVKNTNGATVVVKDQTGGTVIKSVTDDMEGSEPGDDWEYWYMPFYPKDRLLIQNIEPYSTAEITITLTSASGDVEIGMITVGDLRPLATTLNGAEANFVDYSYIDINQDTGENEIEKGPSARDLNVTGWMERADARTADRAMTELLGVPAVWIASTEEDFEGLTSYGLCEGGMKYPDHEQAILNLRVRGLI